MRRERNQNQLRQEDIEKIDFVFTDKRELPKYSRLVEKGEIVEKHDYNLNIRRYGFAGFAGTRSRGAVGFQTTILSGQ